MIYPWLAGTWSQFTQRAGGERMPHALLLAGPAGTGKLELAQHMAAYLLCAAPEAGQACGHCRSCRLLPGGAHPDRFEVLPEDERDLLKVDAVRALIASLTLTTSVSRRKVALIAPAEGMNRNTANALLKCLEEPPGDSVLILVSHDPGRLPVTVRSRCQLLAVSLPEAAGVLEWLQATCQVGADQAGVALAAAAGSPLAARELLGDDTLAAFGKLRQSLARLLDQPAAAAACASELNELDAARAWRWLSLSSAQALQASLGCGRAEWLPQVERLEPRRLSELQRRADRNRNLVPTAVRQDLLLHDWLLEWARQPMEAASTR